MDIGGKTGNPVYAAESGTVEASGWSNGGYGYYIIIYDLNNMGIRAIK